MKYKELSNGDLFSGIGNSSALTNKTTILMKISNTYSIVVQSSLVTLVGSLVSMELYSKEFEEVNFETKFTISNLVFSQFGHYDDDIYIKIKESNTYICCHSKEDAHLTWLNTYEIEPLDTSLVSDFEVVCQISEIEGF